MVTLQHLSFYREYEQPIIDKLKELKPDLNFNFILYDFREHIKGKNLNIITLSPNNFDVNDRLLLLRGSILGLTETSNTIVYLKTIEGNRRLDLNRFRLCMDLIKEVTKLGGFAVLNDIETLCLLILELNERMDNNIILNDYIRLGNIIRYDKFLSETLKENYIENVCLLAQSMKLITELNARSNS